MPKISDYERNFWGRFDTSNPHACWEWPGAKTTAGYGVFRMRYKLHYAHRYAWEIENGAIHDGLHVCHKCDNPLCCNPSHLFLGQPADNIRDAAQKHRMPHGEWHSHSKLTRQMVEDIFRLAETDMSRAELAERFGVSRATLTDVLYGRTWKHIEKDAKITNRAQGDNHPFSKLTPDDIHQIRELHRAGRSQRAIAKSFGVSRGAIDAILKGRTWTHVS